MPIPTDTLWNIRRLNLVFALSSLALVAVCGWAIKQDYEKSWRPFQQNGRVWEDALAEGLIEVKDRGQVSEAEIVLTEKGRAIAGGGQ